MKTRLWLTVSILVFFTFNINSQQIASSASLSTLSSTEALEILTALNEKRQLIPASFMIPGLGFKKLTAEECFGIRTSKSQILVGESSGNNFMRGSTTTPDGQERVMVFIGMFYSEFPFLIQDKTFSAGPYMVMTYRDALELQGDDQSGKHYDASRGRDVPNSLVVEIPLPSQIPDEYLAEKANAVPRFNVSVENTKIYLNVLDNKLQITPK